MKVDDIDHTITISAPPERVWQVITEAALVEQWLGCLQFKPELGARFFMQPDAAKRATGDTQGATHCEVEAIEPPRLLRFSWFLPGTPKTHVDLTLVDNRDGTTTVRLVHSGWNQFDAEEIRPFRDQLHGGWKSAVLPNLKRILESRGDPTSA